MTEAERIAKQQRRRLSVAPQHVGDISAVKAEAITEKKEEENAGLSPLELSAKGGLRVAVQSRKGVVPYNRNKVNQDRAVVKYALGEDVNVSLWGVMDGHGEFGHQVAQFIQERLPAVLAAQGALLRDSPAQSILNGMEQLCAELGETNINVAFSGSTCVFGLKVDEKLYVANIGDSRCIMCRQTGTGELQAIGLSIDQKPDNPEEKVRILKAGGRVEPLPGPPGEDCGPSRVWLAEVDVPGLAMSRSVGDEVSQTVGVISVPEVIVHDITGEDIFAVWASDGVWEFLSNQQVCSIVWKYQQDLSEAAHQLVEESHKQWKKEEEVVDDITCIIVKFNEARLNNEAKTQH